MKTTRLGPGRWSSATAARKKPNAHVSVVEGPETQKPGNRGLAASGAQGTCQGDRLSLFQSLLNKCIVLAASQGRTGVPAVQVPIPASGEGAWGEPLGVSSSQARSTPVSHQEMWLGFRQCDAEQEEFLVVLSLRLDQA